MTKVHYNCFYTKSAHVILYIVHILFITRLMTFLINKKNKYLLLYYCSNVHIKN